MKARKAIRAVYTVSRISGLKNPLYFSRSDASRGLLGKTAQFWLSYMDHVWSVLELLQAVKCNNLLMYAQCLFMVDPFFSFDGHNYSCYLTFFAVFLANIDDNHPGASELLKAGAISVARSLVLSSHSAADKTIGETFMKQAKFHSGLGGCGASCSTPTQTTQTRILTNFSAYQR